MNFHHKDVTFVSGWYESEGTHIWGKNNVYIHIKNQKHKRIVMNIHLAKKNVKQTIEIFDSNQNSLIKKMDMENKGAITLDIPSNDFLFNLHTQEFEIPAYSDVHSTDLRRLSIGISNFYFTDTEILNKIKWLKSDKGKTEHIINYYYENKIYHDSDFKFFENFSMINEGVFLDIGANIGQSALSFSIANPMMKVLSFEPNKLLKGNLEVVKLLLKDQFDYYLYGIGEINQATKFYVPIAENQYFTEEGSFNKNEFNNESYKNRIRVHLKNPNSNIYLKEFIFEIKNLLNEKHLSYFVKIDTQGFELNSLKGISDIISLCNPIIMLEKNTKNGEIIKYLANKDYEFYYYDFKENQLTKTDTNTPNFFFVHRKGTKNSEINKVLHNLIDF